MLIFAKKNGYNINSNFNPNCLIDFVTTYKTTGCFGNK